jgi:hypothetical protein
MNLNGRMLNYRVVSVHIEDGGRLNIYWEVQEKTTEGEARWQRVALASEQGPYFETADAAMHALMTMLFHRAGATA